MTQQCQRGAICPVKIIKDHHQRQLPADVSEQGRHRPEQPRSVGSGGGAPSLASSCDVAKQGRGDHTHLGSVLLEVCGQQVGRRQFDHLTQGFLKKAVGRREVLVTSAVGDRDAVAVQRGAELRDQTGLADAGLAGHQHDDRAARPQAAPGLVERPPLRDTTDKPTTGLDLDGKPRRQRRDRSGRRYRRRPELPVHLPGRIRRVNAVPAGPHAVRQVQSEVG